MDFLSFLSTLIRNLPKSLSEMIRSVNNLSVLRPEKKMSLERNAHFPANDLDQVRGFASGLGVADDGLAIVDGQTTLHSHGDGASVVHVVIAVAAAVVVAFNDVDDVLDVPVFCLPFKFADYFPTSHSILFLRNNEKIRKMKINNKQVSVIISTLFYLLSMFT